MGLFSRNNSSATAAPPEPAVKPSTLTGLVGPASPMTPAAPSAPTNHLIAARPNPAPVAAAPIVRGEREIYFEKMKVRIPQQLVERLDVQNLKTLPPETVRQEVR